ncbi:MAG: ribosome maturation factor RimM [Dissulfurispiraceae bacterium]
MTAETESLITIGRVVRSWGVKGELLVASLGVDHGIFFGINEIGVQHAINDVSQKNDPESLLIQWKKLKSVRAHNNFMVMGIESCDTPEEADKYRGAVIRVKRSDHHQLQAGVYYHDQIIGMMVCTAEGNYLGRITSIIETGSNDVYVVDGNDREYLIPAIRSCVEDIDVESQKMIVRLMEVI